MSLPPNANILWARILIDALRAGGVRHLCASPGSRSGPLILAAHETPGLEISIHIDERSAGFFALGLAKATRSPVALLCTSGTAAANYLPAVCEASHSCVPLILLTADRPPELRFTGAPQTMDQKNLYGGFVRGTHELPLPETTMGGLRSLRQTGRQAVAEACAPPAGPVHIDVPFREPLTPAAVDSEAVQALWESWRREPEVAAPLDRSPADESAIRAAVSRLRKARRPWIVAGPESIAVEDRRGVHELALALHAPILVDVASGLRFRTGGIAHACAHGDLFSRTIDSRGAVPDVVLRLGGLPTSKALNETLAHPGTEVFAVQMDDRRRDPDGIVRGVIRGDAGKVCSILGREMEGRGAAEADWPERFAIAERTARSMLESMTLPLEAAAMRAAIGAMPQRSTLFFSNSMPIRWAETYAEASDEGHEVFVNRGVNGIDGITSTALGTAFGTRAPLLLVTGDLAFLHDLGGLLACRCMEGPVVILLLNNNGGGIFAHLPIARFPEVSVPLFETPHDCNLEPAARIFGLTHARADNARDVASCVASTIGARTKGVIEVRTDRSRMAHDHGEALRELVAGIERAWS